MDKTHPDVEGQRKATKDQFQLREFLSKNKVLPQAYGSSKLLFF